MLLNGVEKLVDDVLNIKAQSFCLRVDEQVDKFFEDKEAKETAIEKVDPDNQKGETAESPSFDDCKDGTDMEIDEVDMDIDNDERSESSPDGQNKRTPSRIDLLNLDDGEQNNPCTENSVTKSIELETKETETLGDYGKDSIVSTRDSKDIEYKIDNNVISLMQDPSSKIVSEPEPSMNSSKLKKVSNVQCDLKESETDENSSEKNQITEYHKEDEESFDDVTHDATHEFEELSDQRNNGRPKRSIKKSWKLKANEKLSDKEEDDDNEAQQKTKEDPNYETAVKDKTIEIKRESDIEEDVKSDKVDNKDDHSADFTSTCKKRKRLSDIKESLSIAEDEDSNDSNVSNSSKKSRGRPKKKKDDKKVVKLQDLLATPKDKEKESCPSPAATEEIRKSRRGRNVKMPQCYSP